MYEASVFLELNVQTLNLFFKIENACPKMSFCYHVEL